MDQFFKPKSLLASVLQAEACKTDTIPTHPHRISNTHRTKSNTTNVVIQQNSRKLLMMDILMSETCWAHKKWNKVASDIKSVFSSSAIISILSCTCRFILIASYRWQNFLTFKVQWLLYVTPFLTLKLMYFIHVPSAVSLCSINWLVLLREVPCVLCDLQTESVFLYINLSLQRVNVSA